MAYASWSVVFGEQPSAAKWNILGTNDAAFNDGSGFAAGALGSSNASLAAGIPCQIAYTNFTAVATGTTTIPHDDTIPQITEGTEFMTQAITPKSATNLLVIDVRAFISSGTGIRRLIAALFQDATANALAVGESISETGTTVDVVDVRHIMVAGTTSSTTFRLRAGGDAASTITFNGDAGGRTYGAITKSSIVIMEYKV